MWRIIVKVGLVVSVMMCLVEQDGEGNWSRTEGCRPFIYCRESIKAQRVSVNCFFFFFGFKT